MTTMYVPHVRIGEIIADSLAASNRTVGAPALNWRELRDAGQTALLAEIQEVLAAIIAETSEPEGERDELLATLVAYFYADDITPPEEP